MAVNYPFEFQVVCIGIDEEMSSCVLYSGLGFSTSYSDAANQLENSFGKELIAIKYLELWEDGDFINVKPSIIENVKLSHHNFDYSKCNQRGDLIE